MNAMSTMRTKHWMLGVVARLWRWKLATACATLLALAAAIPGPWRPASLKAVPPVQASSPVRTVPGGQRLVGDPGQRGATYYSLESQATRVTTRFNDAVVIAERGFDGDFQSRVMDASGNEIRRFKVDRIDDKTDLLQFIVQDGRALQAFRDPAVRPTLDWANHQAYSLWKDGVDTNATDLEWREGLMRPRGAARRDIEHQAVEVETEWANGLSSKTVRKAVASHRPFQGRTVRGNVLVSHLMRDGVEVGTANWFEQGQLLMWDLPGLTKPGYLDVGLMKEFGGWPFVPDMAWLNLQTIAFYHFKSLIKSRGFVAEGRSRPNPIVQFFAPTLRADEGCDDLHWLDGTILRYCCDVHDYCYEKNGCSARSWWQVWSSWTCDFCNMWVVACFFDGGMPPQWGMVK